jgi:hypothetical protein
MGGERRPAEFALAVTDPARVRDLVRRARTLGAQ